MKYFSDHKTEKITKLIRMNYNRPFNNILVLGCGTGIEAAILSRDFSTNVIGIDAKDNFDKNASKYADLRVGDAMSLNFSDASFDLVYSYHVLEHVPEPLIVLKEISRVLIDGGCYFIGTPNRNRLIGYIGSKRATLKQKLSFNLKDWNARIGGRFKNECGAHAGFSSAELAKLLGKVFSSHRNVSDLYYETIYPKHRFLLKLLQSTSIQNYIYPSVYFIGSK